nr:His-Xaa-Ser system radical SAM maturase HxsC [Microvirga zambiensis]
MALPLHTRGTVTDLGASVLYKVLSLADALSQDFPLSKVMVDLRSLDGVDLDALGSIGAGAILRVDGDLASPLPMLHSLTMPEVVASGDVIRVHPSGQVNVLYRRGANANTLFATERCNSRCLMCSQPPHEEDDSWRIGEMIDLLQLIDHDLPVLGITGGEPCLLGEGLVEVLRAAKRYLPNTVLHILTNGRLFSDRAFVRSFDQAAGQVVWAVPVYSDNAIDHDYVVQADGAFNETLNGLHNLAERGHRVEIRCVLHRQTVHRLRELADFAYWNLPFAEHVALMGLEPMGYARSNRDVLWIDQLEYADTLNQAAAYLWRRGIAVSIYNIPLCVLPDQARPFARKSISDWKNVFAPECQGCTLQDSCCGFFRSAGDGWRSRGIQPVGLRAIA